MDMNLGAWLILIAVAVFIIAYKKAIKSIGQKRDSFMVGAAALFVIGLMMGGGIPFQMMAAGAGDLDLGGGQDAAATNCPDDKDSDVRVKLFNDWSTTPGTALASSNVYLRDETTGTFVGNVTTTTDWATISATGLCGNEHSYKLYAVTQRETYGSAMSQSFKLTAGQHDFKLHTNALSKMSVKVKDIDGDDWEDGFTDGSATGTNGTTGVDMNNTLFYESNDFTAFTVGSDGSLNLEIYVKSATAREYGNDKGQEGDTTKTDISLGSYVCVDLGGATNGQEWDTDSMLVTIDGGSSLPDIKSTIDEDSRDYVWVQKSEACYEIGDIDDTYSAIGFYVKAKSGQDPDATDDSITIYILGDGLYSSSDETDTIKKGIFTDASTQAGVLFDIESPYITLKVA